MKAALPLSHWPSWALEIRKKKKEKPPTCPIEIQSRQRFEMEGKQGRNTTAARIRRVSEFRGRLVYANKVNVVEIHRGRRTSRLF